MIDPVLTERVKLTATYLNGLAIAIFAVGGLAPVFSVIINGAPAATPVWLIPLSSAVCWIVSAALHYVARYSLRRLAP